MFINLWIKKIAVVIAVLAIIGCSKTEETKNPFDENDVTIITNNSKIKISLPQINTSEYAYTLQLKVTEDSTSTLLVYFFDFSEQTNNYEKVLSGMEYDVTYYFEVIATMTDGKKESFSSGIKSVQLNGSIDNSNQYYNTNDSELEYNFIKLDSSGVALAIQNLNYSDTGSEAAGTQWSCVLDNDTGIIWEIKTVANFTHRYTWYETNELINGGYAGTSTTCPSGQTICTTKDYIDHMNSINYCGKNDWVLPNPHIYFSIVNFDNPNPAVHQTIFDKLTDLLYLSPANGTIYYWMGTTYAFNNQYAWLIKPYDWSMRGGNENIPTSIKSDFHYVRLVTHLCNPPINFNSITGLCQ